MIGGELNAKEAVVFLGDLMTIALHCGEPNWEMTGDPAVDGPQLIMQATSKAPDDTLAEATQRVLAAMMARDEAAHDTFHAIVEGDTLAEETTTAAYSPEAARAAVEQLKAAKREGESEELQFALATRIYGAMKARRILKAVADHRARQEQS